jgi:hypothetical protein
MWATSAIFMQQPKKRNHPLGENSPNLVTLPPNLFDQIGSIFFFFLLPTMPPQGHHKMA